MSTTIRIPDALRAQVKEATKRAGTTAHQFILQAIVEKTEAESKRSEFRATAEARYANIIASRETIPWNEMRQHLEAKARGLASKKPLAKRTPHRT
jgi:predicted transcriptional regulator